MSSVYSCLALVILGATVMGTECSAEDTLCERDEGIVFSCHIGAKTLSLCQTHGRNLVYRYGTPKKVELTHPDRPVKKTPFFRETLPLYGGGLEYLGFVVKDYEYRIYSKLARTDGTNPEERVPFYEDGLVILRGGKQIRQFVCDDGGEGFRISVEWLPERAK